MFLFIFENAVILVGGLALMKDIADALVKLCVEKTLEVDYVRGWLIRQLDKGKIDNLDYIECLNVINEYDRNNKTRSKSI